MNNKLKVASLFAGIGGICRGFNNVGAEVIWANEFDKNACISYRENFGSNYLVEADIRDIKTENVPEFDILTSGFPCQAFSIAGYRKGFDDERGNLFFQTLRFIVEKQPKAFLLENVKNLVSHDKGKTFKVITEALKENGYYIKYDILNTMKYSNLPQNRERIYIVGFKKKEQCDMFQFPQPIELTKSIHDIIDVTDKKEERYYYENSKYYPMLLENMHRKDTVYQLRRIYVRENKSCVCPTLTANMGTGGHNVPLIIDDYGIRKLTPRECFGFQGFDNFKFPVKMCNGQLYKQIGNSVSVKVIEKIAQNIIKVLEEYKS